MNGKVFSIGQLNHYIREIFENEELLHGISVRGEVGSCNLNRQNLFLTLKDEGGMLSCVFFDYKGAEVREGEKVVVRGTPVYSPKYGVLRFNAAEIIPEGKGELFARFLALKKRLEEEGLFRPETKKAVPRDAARLAVVTSPKGAVIRDIITTVRKRNPYTDIYIIPVRVQGAGADSEIAAAVRLLDGYEVKPDALIIARGGGAGEDLEAFNSEEVVRAVAACRIPTVSAVGHETDISLCDMAADLRVATPTAAAQETVADFYKAREELILRLKYIRRSFQSVYAQKTAQIYSACNALSAMSTRALNRKYDAVASYAARAQRALENLYSARLLELERYKTRLYAANPLSLLEKGYAKILKGGRVISAADLKAGDDVELLLADGTAEAQIKSVKEVRRVKNNG